jgi:membrane peptidoglycan carboxypeptidase
MTTTPDGEAPQEHTGEEVEQPQPPVSYSGRASVPTPVTGRASVRPPEPPPYPHGPVGMPPQTEYYPQDYPPGYPPDEAPRPAKGAKPPLTKEARRKREKRRRLLIAGLAVVILLSGVGLIAGTYYYDKVLTPDELTLENSTEVYASDGTTQIARLGSKNRTEIGMDKLAKPIRDALIAGEDKNFYTHHGIDLWGIARAAWNNLTGGSTQGASTITQQYARRAANDMDVTYARKLREAIMARKLEDQYSKEEILGFYLNTVYFGRGAYGVAAAADQFFGIPPDKIDTMTVEQAAVLGAVLRQPEPDGNVKGYDPQNDPQAAKDRWNYVLNNMVDMGWLDKAKRTTMQYPEIKPFDAAKQAGATGYTDRGTGHVINYVADELAQRGVVKYLTENGLGNWKNAGLRVTTTIDQRVQNAMEQQLNRDIPGSALSSQKPNIIGAGVAINPANGQVLAYYGGTNNGTDTDWAGKEAPHPPASSFKIYTLSAGIADGISIKSRWDSRELKKANGDPVDLTNANREGDNECGAYCTLEEMTIKSFNVPFWRMTAQIGATKVMTMAANAGVRTAWTTNPERAIDLTQPAGRTQFDPYAGIGQYPITVLDHANGTATIANHGVYNRAHFVLKVERKNRKTGKWERLPMGDEKLDPKQTVPRAVADEVVSVLKQIPGAQAAAGNGRESAGKTGTWENGLKKADGITSVFPNSNAHAWFTGFISQVEATFWVGSNDHNATPIKDPKGNNIGSAYTKGLWKKFMDQVVKDLNLPATKLAAGSGGTIGDQTRGTGQSPTPSPEPEPNPTPTPKPTGLPTLIPPTPTGTKKPGVGEG